LIGSPPTPILRQMSKIYADITMSLDGFITVVAVATTNGR